MCVKFNLQKFPSLSDSSNKLLIYLHNLTHLQKFSTWLKILLWYPKESLHEVLQAIIYVSIWVFLHEVLYRYQAKTLGSIIMVILLQHTALNIAKIILSIKRWRCSMIVLWHAGPHIKVCLKFHPRKLYSCSAIARINLKFICITTHISKNFERG